jgi:phage FluMu gp28-like protein
VQEKQPDTDAFAQEFGCEPISDKESYLGEFLDAARLRYDENFTAGSLYGGFDVARSANGDYAALAEVRRHEDRYQASPIVWAERGKDFEAMQTEASRRFKDRDWQRMGVDSTGLGMETAERLQKSLGTSKVDAVYFSPQEKDKMMTTLRSLLEMGQLALPPDQELLLDLRAIKRIVGQSSVRYDAKHDELRGHADRAWALALAVRAAGKARPESKQPSTYIRNRRRPREPMF